MYLTLHVLVLIFLSTSDSSIFDFDVSDGNNENLGPIVRAHDKKQRFQIESNNALRVGKRMHRKEPKDNLFEKVMMLKRKTKEEYEKEIQNKNEYKNFDSENTEYTINPLKKNKRIEYKTIVSKEPLMHSDYRNNKDAKMKETKTIGGLFGYALDPVLNNLSSRRTDYRRKDTSSDSELSSSQELQDWKDEWKEYWLKKKFEAANAAVVHGDEVNMVAASEYQNR